MGKFGPSSCQGAHTKDGLYLLWACGHGPIGLVNGPIGLAEPYFIFYPLQALNLTFLFSLKNLTVKPRIVVFRIYGLPISSHSPIMGMLSKAFISYASIHLSYTYKGKLFVPWTSHAIKLHQTSIVHPLKKNNKDGLLCTTHLHDNFGSNILRSLISLTNSKLCSILTS